MTTLHEPHTGHEIDASDVLEHQWHGAPLKDADLAQCGTCHEVWCYTCTPTPAWRCPFEYDHEDDAPSRPTVLDEAERLQGYWTEHGNDPEVVQRWAVSDLMAFVTRIVDES